MKPSSWLAWPTWGEGSPEELIRESTGVGRIFSDPGSSLIGTDRGDDPFSGANESPVPTSVAGEGGLEPYGVAIRGRPTGPWV